MNDIFVFLEICQVRLDFFKAVLQQPASSTGSCTKTYITSTPGATGSTAYNTPPKLCGTLTDQHCKMSYIAKDKCFINLFIQALILQFIFLIY